MNRKNIKTLITALESGPIKVGHTRIGFNMGRWYEVAPRSRDRSGHKCGKVACLGGWTDILFSANGEGGTTRGYLGLDYQQGLDLFYPSVSKEWNDITLSEAVTTLKKLLRTGKVDWSHVK